MRGQWGEKFVGLGDLARLILVTAHAEGRVTHARIRELTDQHSRDVTLKLQELVRGGFLVSAGGGRGTSYSLRAGALDGNRPKAQLSLFAEEAGGDGSPPQSYPQSPPQTLLGAGAAGANAQGPDLVARVAATNWATKTEVRAAIAQVCSEDYCSVAEIARALNRRAATIQQNYIAAMVAEGVLVRKYGDNPSHPDQAYRTRREVAAG